MSLTYGMPYHLEDTTGNLSDSTFTDLHQRLSFSVRTTMRSADRTVIMIHNLPSEMGHSGLMVPAACLDFGANNALGTVKIGQGQTVEMDQYLSRVSRKCVPSLTLCTDDADVTISNSMVRKFDASDSQTYTWTYTATEDAEWTVSRALSSESYLGTYCSLRLVHE